MKINVKNICILITFIVVSVLIYRPSLENGFVGDDMYLIVKNNFVHSWQNLPRLFQQNYISSLVDVEMLGKENIGSGELSYRPVRALSFFVDYAIWKNNPWGYHLTNLLIHLLNVILVYLLARRLEFNTITASVTALVFCLHPINNEVIAMIYTRGDSLAFLFFALALIFYQNFRNSGYRQYAFYGMSLVMYFLALFSKEIAMTLPFVIMAYDYCFPSTQKFRERSMFYLGYLGLALFYLWVWFFVMRPSAEGLLDYFNGNWLAVFATMIRICGLYIKWLIYPWDIPTTMADDSIVVWSLANPAFIMSLLMVLFVLILFVNSVEQKFNKLTFALLWGFITISPVMALPWMFNVLYAARFLYLPAIGFCLILGLVADYVQKHKEHQVVACVLGLGLFVFYASININHLETWKDNLSVSIDRLKHYPQNPLSLTSTADAFEEQGMSKEAKTFMEQSIEVNPQCSDCFNWLGLHFVRSGDLVLAEKKFRQAMGIDANFESANTNLCNVLGQQGSFAASKECFEDMIRKHPKSIRAYYNLGITYARVDQKADALSVWKSGLLIEPNSIILKNAIKKLSN